MADYRAKLPELCGADRCSSEGTLFTQPNALKCYPLRVEVPNFETNAAEAALSGAGRTFPGVGLTGNCGAPGHRMVITRGSPVVHPLMTRSGTGDHRVTTV
ncbi:MAG: hypothetical protein AB9869_37965 [Verrucomicrobiia bacterium]